MNFHVEFMFACLIALVCVLAVNGDCSCLNHMSKYGFGNCKRYSWALKGKMCYVDSTSTCSDKMLSQTENGIYKSAVACRHPPVGCTCLNHMSPYGYGNCKKFSWALRGKMCYVKSTSTCLDKLPSQTESGLHKSAMACNRPVGSCKTTPSDYIGPFYVKKEYTLETQCIAFSKTNPNPGKCDDEEYTKEPIRIQGKIMDTQCNRVDGAIIEYWQAAPKWSDSHSKVYTMVTMACKGDCIADMDYKGYRGWQTATNGDYQLNTVRPGIYNDRPIRHIHFKITVPGKKIDGKDSLITQMYLPQDEPTTGDILYDRYISVCQRYTNKPELWAKKQKLDTCPIRAEPDGANYYYGNALTVYNWDIVLNISQ